jgi:peptidoglycan/xylan/chitin deacetylase (PgdA/CDA1 family)
MVISLDFELHWGIRDHADRTSAAYADLIPSRRVVSELSERFEERAVRATWATVGMLFASSRDEVEAVRPARRPAYRRSELDPYVEPIGESEDVDPQHLAGSLVRQLAARPGQEVASHTFSHFYCLEDGQSEADLRADLGAAQAIAAALGLSLTSLVLPRNQWNPGYAAAVLDAGFTCIRGPQPSFGHRARSHEDHGALDRAGRLVDTYAGISPPPTTAWDAVLRPDGLCDVPASAFLRPYSPGRRRLEPLRRHRLLAGMRDAARRGRIFHLWWHPQNFARHPQESYALLEELLDEFDRLAHSDGLRSLTMRDVATTVTTAGTSGTTPAG